MTTSFAHLHWEDGEIAVISIDNPPINALVSGVFADVLTIVQQLQISLPRAVVLTGSREAFAVGGEISETRRIHFEGRTDIPDGELDDAVARITDPVYVRELGEKYQRTFAALSALPCAVVAAVEGMARGGGLEFALACDYRVTADDAQLGSPEVTLGGGTIGGGLARMAALIGTSRAKKMYLGGQLITAQEALAIGLVDEVAPSGEAVDRALELARVFAAFAGPAQANMKAFIDRAGELSHEEAATIELDMWCESYSTSDSKTRLRDFFKNGRKQASTTP
ncbi:enoyl-CoA hydratase/isomerase family protein [Aeromicrobium sp. UC242_57]|uniref:enoyl-CoA hydratase/isomerase family protein n=1 Tax=Aeromicrobium sp. UC242_57 TaxID=3374624 RepID=UPI00379F6977